MRRWIVEVLGSALLVGTGGFGCGDDTTGTGATATGGAGGTGGETATGGAGGSGGDTATGGSGGSAGDDNDTIATADPMDPDGGGFHASGELDPPQADVDYYAFEGTAGIVIIQGDAKPSSDRHAPGYLDLVISLYDSNGQLVARNDDPFPPDSQDSRIATILPSDGTYYVEVEEYCAYAKTSLGEACTEEESYFAGLTHLGYQLSVTPEGALSNPIVEEATEPGNDTLGGAAVMPFVLRSPGDYYDSIGFGTFGSSSDVDAWRFTVPSDVTIGNGRRLRGAFIFQPAGSESGDGSSRFVGTARIIDASTSAVVAEVDSSGENVPTDYPSPFPPLTPGADYLMTVQAGESVPGALSEFFLFNTYLVEGFPVEKAEQTNDQPATAEVLDLDPTQNGYVVDGDLALDDIDYFRISVPAGKLVHVACFSQRNGSGVEGLTATVLAASDGSMLGSSTETADAAIHLPPIDPGGESELIVEIKKTGQNPAVEGTFYNCAFFLRS